MKLDLSSDIIQTNRGSHLDEIRGFGGLKGLKSTKDKAVEGSIPQEIYSGLRLRIDIFYTHKPVSRRFSYIREKMNGFYSF